ALADDSGLSVDALDGAPGVYSARYAGESATDADNNRKLLTALQGVPEAERGARYHCALVYLRHPRDEQPIICEAHWEGRILEAPRGDGGFGYDPLFYSIDHGCSAAELSSDLKNRDSHRGKALQALLAALEHALQ
ncbi:MAG: non-canonical purine NTP pyrophosphatase, partial [Halieaceae bacterium]|nr:non-canonical purine NTP pyrophosphatase [Halieaceae bacterium]